MICFLPSFFSSFFQNFQRHFWGLGCPEANYGQKNNDPQDIVGSDGQQCERERAREREREKDILVCICWKCSSPPLFNGQKNNDPQDIVGSDGQQCEREIFWCAYVPCLSILGSGINNGNWISWRCFYVTRIR
eukprot:TRINITY_DN4130_c0_g2_i1.p1 TRINITY_DN4130_c0_g2~~TRINITY_DN4130_c0_g2_i1.p1  ORF type:complete len:133 (-),score=15.35 TRINITY_DN4130_c0_g2_i1:25-423(-)